MGIGKRCRVQYQIRRKHCNVPRMHTAARRDTRSADEHNTNMGYIKHFPLVEENTKNAQQLTQTLCDHHKNQEVRKFCDVVIVLPGDVSNVSFRLLVG